MSEPISNERFAVLVERAGLKLTPEQFEELRQGYQFVERIDPLQISLGQSDRGEPALGDRAASLCDGKKRRVHRRPQTLG